MSLTLTESRALSLLGSGSSAEQVASALGVTPSYISQLLANEDFKLKVAELRYANLAKHNQRDDKLDALEDKVLEKLESTIALCFKPMELVKAFQVINGAKRRGQSAPAQIVNTQNLVTINMPTQIINKFTSNIHNQVVQVGSQNLETIQSGSLLKQVKQENPNETRLQRAISHTESCAAEASRIEQEASGQLIARCDAKT